PTARRASRSPSPPPRRRSRSGAAGPSGPARIRVRTWRKNGRGEVPIQPAPWRGINGRRKEVSMATLEKWMPLQELDPIERRMRRLFEDLKFVPPTTPAADV